MQSWLILTLISIFVLAIGEVGQKLSLTSVENISAEATNVVVATIQFFLAIAFLFVFRIPLVGLDTPSLILLIFVGIVNFWMNKFLYSSYKGNSISISQIIFSTSAMISAILGIIFFQEDTNVLKFIGIGILLLAFIIVNYAKGEKINKYHVLAIVAAMINGVVVLMDKKLSNTMDPNIYQVYLAIVFILASLFFRPRQIYKDVKKLNWKLWKTILVTAITFSIFNKLIFIAYSQGGEAGKITAISNSSVFIIIILEVLLLKDRKNLKLKIFATALTVIGIYLLARN